MEVQFEEPEPDFFSIISQDADSSCMSLAPDYSEAPSREARGYTKLSREDKRRQRRASEKYRMAHATRERLRVEVRLTGHHSVHHTLTGLQQRLLHPEDLAAHPAPR